MKINFKHADGHFQDFCVTSIIQDFTSRSYVRFKILQKGHLTPLDLLETYNGTSRPPLRHTRVTQVIEQKYTWNFPKNGYKTCF